MYNYTVLLTIDIRLYIYVLTKRVVRYPDTLPGTVNDPYINSSCGSTQRGPIRCGRLIGGLDWNGGLERWNQPSRTLAHECTIDKGKRGLSMNARSRGRLGPRG